MDSGGQTITPHPSDSREWLNAEPEIRTAFEKHLGRRVGSLQSRVLPLVDGDEKVVVDVDAVSDDNLMFAEIFARVGKLKPGQRKKVAQDVLKLVTLLRDPARFPGATAHLVFIDNDARQSISNDSWLGQAIRLWGVEVHCLTIDQATIDRIRTAGDGATMVNVFPLAAAVSLADASLVSDSCPSE